MEVMLLNSSKILEDRTVLNKIPAMVTLTVMAMWMELMPLPSRKISLDGTVLNVHFPVTHNLYKKFKMSS